ncbi:MAG: FAD-binding oxidoreductase, partial [Acidimicrobiia bacterium]
AHAGRDREGRARSLRLSSPMVTQASLISDLQSIVGTDHARAPEDGRFVVDSMRPQVAVEPGSYEEVATVLRYASETSSAVIPWGGGTMMYIGNVPMRYDLALDLGRLNRIIEHEPTDLTITCQAGITVGRLQNTLSEFDQMVPLSSSFDPLGTVGGVLAVNSWGPERHVFGSPRDYTIGMRVITADGRITRAGGKVVKNVAGYDLCKLYIGSLGTLGVIVEATFKVQPLPKASTWMIVGCGTVEESCSMAREVDRKGLSVWSVAVEHYTWDALVKPYLLWLAVAGTHAGVERTIREVTDLASASGLESWESPPRESLPLGKSWTKLHPEIELKEVTGLECKAMVAPEHTADVMSALTSLGSELHLSILPTIGLVRAQWTQTSPAEIETLLSGLSAVVGSYKGTATVLFGDPAMKRRIDVFGDPPPAFELMRRVKMQFDPNGILSPGRFVGRL